MSLMLILSMITGVLALPGSPPGDLPKDDGICFIIKKTTIGHCAWGTASCKKCREAYRRKYCLLNTCPEGQYARRIVEVEIDGVKKYREFDIEKIFDNYESALAYSKENNILFIEEPMPEPDTVLEKLKSQLPVGWQMTIENEQLIIKRNEQVYAMFENQINAPIRRETEEQYAKRIKKYGKPVHCRFVFEMESKWFPERLEKLKADNAALYREIEKLPKKYKIARFFKPFGKRPGPTAFPGKFSDEEKKRIAEYEKEKKELEKKLVELPGYASENYCLFLVKQEGMPDEYTAIYPEKASEETYAIKRKFAEVMEVLE